MPKWCAHIASTKSSEVARALNKGNESDIQSKRSVLNSLAYVQQVSEPLEGTFDSPKYWSKFTIGIYVDHTQVKRIKIKSDP